MISRILASLTLVAFSVPAATQTEAPYFASAKEGGAKVYAWKSRNSKIVRTLDKGALMQVHDELSLQGGETPIEFLEVSVIDGLEVWVYGQYLEPIEGMEGVMRCTGDHVRMRPGPGKSTVNLPLSTHLMRGDQVRFLGRGDASLPMAEDWVKVRSPQASRGWILADKTERASDQAAAGSAFAAAAPKPAIASASVPTQSTAELGDGRTTEAGAATAPTRSLLAEADELFAKANSGQASFQEAVVAYEAALAEATPGTSLHMLASQQLERARAGVELEEIQSELASKRAAEARARQDAALEEEREQLRDTMHWGRFNGRGWVRARKAAAGKTRYYLEWQGEIVREVTCASGRYDLSVFESCEIGVQGDRLRNPTPSTEDGPAQPLLLDVRKLEIISVRS